MSGLNKGKGDPVDPVADIGRRLAEVTNEIRRRDAERAAADSPAARLELERELLALGDLQESLEMSVSHMRATSPAGAMVHVIMAGADFSMMEAFADGGQEGLRDQRRRSAYRNLYSALDVLSVLSGIAPEAVGAGMHMPAHADDRVPSAGSPEGSGVS